MGGGLPGLQKKYCSVLDAKLFCFIHFIDYKEMKCGIKATFYIQFILLLIKKN